MPKAYFEPKTLAELGAVLERAKAILARRGEDTPINMDWVARRILELASQGIPPEQILAQVMKPLSPFDAGLKTTEIKISFSPNQPCP
ncbi:hypothetical protein [Taklimakanibacter albus]|uniref:Uncharacterized protein n=1 Tax=Taklimakanibacter albus TaxID=2800327 RepID=A0ACC5R2F9_9HYPH|nr:hypothetical protein [Aestuariivirga sp. YIM B02566]MBK1866790.1 hypothetical protein [Aestuariivirga sp. YIM B02566]